MATYSYSCTAVQLYRCKLGSWRGRFLARFRMYVFFLKLLVDVPFLAPDPCFQFWGRRLPPPLSTVSCADMVWTDAILAVLWWQLQQPPA